MSHTQQPAVGVEFVGERIHAARLEIAPLGHARNPEGDGVAPKGGHFHTGDADQAQSLRCVERFI